MSSSSDIGSQHASHASWAAPLCHPATLLALLLLVLNDHLLKGSGLLPAWLTGKLSDLAGLFVLPALWLTLIRGLAVLTPRRGRGILARLETSSAALYVVVTACGCAFGAANLWTPFNSWLATWFGVKVMDPTDLLALPALLAGAHVVRVRWIAPLPARGCCTNTVSPVPWPRLSHTLQLGACGVAALALCATSPPRVTYPRDYALWKLSSEDTRRLGPLSLTPWISVSGKIGLGLSLCVESHEQQPLELAVESATLVVARGPQQAQRGQGRQVTLRERPKPTTLKPGQAVWLYLPLAFDNNAAWNEGQREAALSLTLKAGEQRLQHRMTLQHRRPGYHRAVHRYPYPKPSRTDRPQPAGPKSSPCQRPSK